MYFVCDSNLKTLSEWASLACAKAAAQIRKTEYPNQVFFVCGNDGRVIAGF